MNCGSKKTLRGLLADYENSSVQFISMMFRKFKWYKFVGKKGTEIKQDAICCLDCGTIAGWTDPKDFISDIRSKCTEDDIRKLEEIINCSE